MSAWLFTATIADRKTVKSWFETSTVYQTFTDEIITQSTIPVDQNNLTLDQNTLKTAAQVSFTPEVLQNSTETFLDASYDWLEGTSQKLSFSIDFTQQKADFSQSISDQAITRLNSLPLCSNAELTQLGAQSTAIDPFTVSCRPPDAMNQSLAADLERSVALSPDFIPNSVITDQDLKRVFIDTNNSSFEETFSYVPSLFRLAKAGVIIALGLFAASLITLRMLGVETFRIARRLAKSLFFSALSTGILSGIITYYSSQAADSTDASFVESLIGVAAPDILKITLTFTGIYIMLAIMCFILYRLLKKRWMLRHSTTPEQPYR